jgi:hypothetical protein
MELGQNKREMDLVRAGLCCASLTSLRRLSQRCCHPGGAMQLSASPEIKDQPELIEVDPHFYSSSQ